MLTFYTHKVKEMTQTRHVTHTHTHTHTHILERCDIWTELWYGKSLQKFQV